MTPEARKVSRSNQSWKCAARPLTDSTSGSRPWSNATSSRHTSASSRSNFALSCVLASSHRYETRARVASAFAPVVGPRKDLSTRRFEVQRQGFLFLAEEVPPQPRPMVHVEDDHGFCHRASRPGAKQALRCTGRQVGPHLARGGWGPDPTTQPVGSPACRHSTGGAKGPTAAPQRCPLWSTSGELPTSPRRLGPAKG